MASRGRGAKQKGSRFELRVAQRMREMGLDPNAGRMPLSGADSHLKGDIRTDLPYVFEAKCQERVALWKWWQQAADQAHYHPPVLCISANHRPVLAVVELDTLFNLMLCERELLNTPQEEAPCSKPSGQSKWKRTVDGRTVLR